MSDILPSIVSDTDKNTILKSTSNDRYIVVYNSTNDIIYPIIQAYDNVTGVRITDTLDIPSGFELDAGQYKLIKFPQYVISGRIEARTGCTMIKGRYADSKTTDDGLYCKTADCPLPYPSDTYSKSQKGVLPQDVGGKPPSTVVEFSFTNTSTTDKKGRKLIANTDYYDISQVDGSTISASMQPIINQKPPDPKNEFWCNKAECILDLDCPDELKVYDNDGTWIACQSICAAVSGMQTNFDDKGNQVDPPMIPDGKGKTMFQDFTGPLKTWHKKDYDLLVTMFKQQYHWDEKQNKPVFLNDPNNTGAGRWVLDTTGICKTNDPTCISTSTLVCCNNNSTDNKCGDVGGGTDPSFGNIASQGCSPYVLTKDYSNTEYDKHKCWSENWPSSKSLTDYCTKKGITNCNYHEVFKQKCPKAYSWAFDDNSSTYTCNSISTPPVHYIIQFGNSSTPPGPKPPGHPVKKKTFWTLTHILMIAGAVVLFLIILFVSLRKR